MERKQPVKFGRPSRFWGAEVSGLAALPKIISPGYVMAADHAHSYYEIMFNFSPIPVRHSVFGKCHETGGRYILWRAPYVLHSVQTLTDADYVRSQIAFPPFVMSECLKNGDIGRLRRIRACTIPTTEEQMEFLDQMLGHMRYLWECGASESIRYGVLAALLYEIGQLVPEDIPMDSDTEMYVQDVMYHISDHMDEELSLDALAKKFFVSRRKLAQDFREVTGQSVHDCVTTIRLDQARSLLMNEKIPLSVIAARCGFSASSSFVRIFRREFGMTPGEWRKRYLPQT